MRAQILEAADGATIRVRVGLDNRTRAFQAAVLAFIALYEAVALSRALGEDSIPQNMALVILGGLVGGIFLLVFGGLRAVMRADEDVLVRFVQTATGGEAQT